MSCDKKGKSGSGKSGGHAKSKRKPNSTGKPGSRKGRPVIIVPGVGEPVTCSGSNWPVGGPFMQAPFGGYTSINSYFDHDLPDYAVDGKMVLANGTTVSGAPSSHAWPAYYSSGLRQYINYDGHNGYDYGITYQPVYAAAAGKVRYAAWESADPTAGYGQMILIAHAGGYETLYGHLSRIFVRPGETVKVGQRIGISGTTGRSTGPHLHFTVYHNCHVVDPYGWSGPGRDPLLKFNGEQSTYLWLDGAAPRILNPLSSWPTFRSSLALNPNLLVSPAPTVPLTHLLLLRLPVLSNAAPDYLLASVQVRLQQEERAVTRLLFALRARKAIDWYRTMPNLGAIEVGGRAPAQELLGLPGVAAIWGARPLDIKRARQAYAEALISSVSTTITTPLFPSTYLDAAPMARITMSVEENGSYIFGTAPIGASVRIAVSRGGRVVGQATATADNRQGAFVAMVTNTLGKNLRIESRDVISGRAKGVSTTVNAAELTITADAARGTIRGTAPIGARLSISGFQSLSGRPLASTLETASRGKQGVAPYVLKVSGALAPGDPVSVLINEASGNSLFRWANIPGFRVDEGSSEITGWAPSWTSWKATVFKNHHVQSTGAAVTPLAGEVEITLRDSHGKVLGLTPGDNVRLIGGTRTQWIRVPAISVSPQSNGTALSGHGPARAELVLERGNGGDEVTQTVARVSARGRYVVKLSRPMVSGASFDVLYQGPSGAVIGASSAARGLTIHANSGAVEGQGAPNQVLVLTAFDGERRVIGTGVAETGATGEYSTTLYQRGSTVRLYPGDTVNVFDGGAGTGYPVTRLSATLSKDGAVEGWTQQPGRASISLWSAGRLISNGQVGIRRHRFRVDLQSLAGLGPDAAIDMVVGSPALGAMELDLPLPSAGLLGDTMAFIAARRASNELPPVVPRRQVTPR